MRNIYLDFTEWHGNIRCSKKPKIAVKFYEHFDWVNTWLICRKWRPTESHVCHKSKGLTNKRRWYLSFQWSNSPQIENFCFSFDHQYHISLSGVFWIKRWIDKYKYLDHSLPTFDISAHAVQYLKFRLIIVCQKQLFLFDLPEACVLHISLT